MTDEELENKAFSKIKEYLLFDYTEYEANAFEIGYVAGAKENSIVWHDLRKNPKDLPRANQQICVCYVCHVDNEKHTVVGAYQQVGYHCIWHTPYNNAFDDEVIAWCELPKPPKEYKEEGGDTNVGE